MTTEMHDGSAKQRLHHDVPAHQPRPCVSGVAHPRGQSAIAGKAVDPPIQGSDLIVVEESGIKVAFKQVKDVLPFAVLGTVF